MRTVLIIAMVLLFAGCTAEQTQDSSAGQFHEEEQVGGFKSKAVGTYSEAAIIVKNERQIFEFSDTTTEDGELLVHYFYLPGCSACKAISPEIIKLETKYPGARFFRYDITTQDGSWAYEAFAEQYNLSMQQRYVPQVLVNGTILTDRFNINESLEDLIRAYFSES